MGEKILKDVLPKLSNDEFRKLLETLILSDDSNIKIAEEYLSPILKSPFKIGDSVLVNNDWVGIVVDYRHDSVKVRRCSRCYGGMIHSIVPRFDSVSEISVSVYDDAGLSEWCSLESISYISEIFVVEKIAFFDSGKQKRTPDVFAYFNKPKDDKHILRCKNIPIKIDIRHFNIN